MKEKTKAYYKTVFKWWAKNRLKPFLIKAGIVLLIVAVAFGLFVLLMAYLVACGVESGLEIQI